MAISLRVLGLIGAVSVMGVSSAQAEVNVWRDPVSKMSVSYHDTWHRVNSQAPNDILTIRPPSGNDVAECKVNVKPEGRFKIFPVHYSDEVQRLYVSRDHWDDYFGRYNNTFFHDVIDNAGLSHGAATMAYVSYQTDGGIKMDKRAIAYSSHYRNNIYTVECSAQEVAYPKWHDKFMNVIKSVQFRKGTNFALSGYYRDFIQDNTLKVRGPTIYQDSYLGIHQP